MSCILQNYTPTLSILKICNLELNLQFETNNTIVRLKNGQIIVKNVYQGGLYHVKIIKELYMLVV